MRRISGMEIAHMTADECREALRELENSLPTLREWLDQAQTALDKNLRTHERITSQLVKILEREVKHED